ncbi:MAG: FixH family protein, partial [Pararhodobacter sp.]
EDGNPAPVADISVLLGRPTTTREDTTPELQFENGAFVADVDAEPGNWDLRITAEAGDGTAYAYRIGLIHNR